MELEPWPRDRFDVALDYLAEARAIIGRLMGVNRPTYPCGSTENPHMWVTLKRNDGTEYTTCGKCGAAW